MKRLLFACVLLLFVASISLAGGRDGIRPYVGVSIGGQQLLKTNLDKKLGDTI